MSTNEAGAPVGTGQITVYLGTNVVHTFGLSMPVLTIGRSPDNALPLSDDPKVSRHHAELRLTPEGTVLTDLGSANGTIVGGTPIAAHQPYLLANGTVFYIGSYGFVYEALSRTEPAAGDGDGHPAGPQREAIDTGTVTDGQNGATSVTPPAPSGQDTPATPLAAEQAAPEAGPSDAAGPPLPAPPPPPPPPPPPTAMADTAPTRRGRRAEDESASDGVSLPPPAPPPPPRTTWESPSPPGPLSSYLQDLPVLFQDSDFLGRYLLILESIWEPIEQRQDHIDLYFDARTSPPSFLHWLATWLDPALETNWPEERLRHIVSRAMDLYRWRGTRFGLAQMIELCTGIAPRITEDTGAPFCFRIRLEVPRNNGVDRRLIEQLITAQKPAHTGYVLEMAVQS